MRVKRKKAQEHHEYFWLVGAGGPGNTRTRTNSEEIERRTLINLKHRAEALGVPFNLSLGDLPIPNRCPVFGYKFKKNNGPGGIRTSRTVDRIIPSKGYTKGNVVVVSLRANVIKETFTLEQMEKRLSAYQKYVADLEKVVRFYRKINKNGRN